MGRGAIAVVTGLVAGLTVSTLVGIPQLDGPASLTSLLENSFTFWGLFFGCFTALAAFGVALMVLGRRGRQSRVGRTIAILVLAVFGLITWWWIVMWGFSPFTLEGMWIYPLAIVPSGLAIWMLWGPRRARRVATSGRVDWTHPPA